MSPCVGGASHAVPIMWEVTHRDVAPHAVDPPGAAVALMVLVLRMVGGQDAPARFPAALPHRPGLRRATPDNGHYVNLPLWVTGGRGGLRPTMAGTDRHGQPMQICPNSGPVCR